MTFLRIVYMWTGYWTSTPLILKDEPLDPPNIFVNTTLSFLASGVWAASGNVIGRWRYDLRSCLFFPLTYYFSHPETHYFRPVDPLIVVLAAVAVPGRQKQSVDA